MTRFDRFMDDCMAEATSRDNSLTGKALGGGQQLGALETLKNMMFKMQSFSSSETPAARAGGEEGRESDTAGNDVVGVPSLHS